jgi:hypothetical protein
LSPEEWAAWRRLSAYGTPEAPFTDVEKELYKAVINRASLEVGQDQAVRFFHDLTCTWWDRYDPVKYQRCFDDFASYAPTERGKLLIQLLKLHVLHTKLSESMKYKNQLVPQETSYLWLEFEELYIDLTKYPQNLMSRSNYNQSRFIDVFRKLTARKIEFSETAAIDFLRAIRNHSTNKIFFDKKLSKYLLAHLKVAPSGEYLAEIQATKEWFQSGEAFMHREDYLGQSRNHLRDALKEYS